MTNCKIYMMCIITFLCASTIGYAQSTYKQTMKIMGCKFDITVIAQDQEQANNYITLAVDEMSRVERLISSWDPSSQTSEINRNAGIKPVPVDYELFSLIERSLKISKLTDGAFDISFASIEKIWRFDGKASEAPSDEEIGSSVAKIGYHHIILNKMDTTVLLEKEGMRIGFGAIGKGYAADRAKDLLVSMGVIGGIINASGDMNTWGVQTNGENWNVAITNPTNPKESFGIFPLTKGAVVTSGNYEKFTLINGKRYAHIVDPRTGWPMEGILSVTVFSPSAEIADAMATAVFVMGVDVGLDRINQLPNLECILVDDQGQLHYSKNIQLDLK